MCQCEMCIYGLICDREFNRAFKAWSERSRPPVHAVKYDPKNVQSGDVYQSLYDQLYNMDDSKVESRDVQKRLDELDGQYQHEDSPFYDDFEQADPKPVPKCECGADSCELPYHSGWCPKVKEGV